MQLITENTLDWDPVRQELLQEQADLSGAARCWCTCFLQQIRHVLALKAVAGKQVLAPMVESNVKICVTLCCFPSKMFWSMN